MSEEKIDPLDAAINEARGGEPAAVDPPAEAAVEAPPEIELPQHWSDDEKAKWGALPKEHKALLLDARKSIEAGYNTKSQKLSDKARFWKELKKIYAPLQGQLQQGGATKLQATRNLVNAQLALQSQPDAAFEHLARNFAASRSDAERQAILARFARGLGFSPGAASQPQAKEDYLDPVAGQQIAQLKQQLSQLAQGFTQQTALAKQAAITQAEQVIQGFAKDHPHFAEVQGDVEILLASPRVPAHLPAAERLAKAYDIAVRMNPEVWEKIETAKKAEKAKADADKRRAEVDQSKKAARNPEGQPVAAVSKGTGKLDDIIKEAMGSAAA